MAGDVDRTWEVQLVSPVTIPMWCVKGCWQVLSCILSHFFYQRRYFRRVLRQCPDHLAACVKEWFQYLLYDDQLLYVYDSESLVNVPEHTCLLSRVSCLSILAACA